MALQLSIYWQSASALEWHWAHLEQSQKGTLENLGNEIGQLDQSTVPARLFLPDAWFSNLVVPLPPKTRRLSPSLLGFAAEEFLALNIDDAHLVVKSPNDGQGAVVSVCERHRLTEVISQLLAIGIQVQEAFDCKDFKALESEHLSVRVNEEDATVRYKNQTHSVHLQGFLPWFSGWLTQNSLNDALEIDWASDQQRAENDAMIGALRADGAQVHVITSPKPILTDWVKCVSSRRSYNVMVGEFAVNAPTFKLGAWRPALVAASFLFVFWCALMFMQQRQFNQQIDRYWQASESVFLQVFGAGKRIQRPLMVREMRAIASAPEQTEVRSNALTFLNDLTRGDASLQLEDFRYNRDRAEAFFTLVQDSTQTGDAFAKFEQLKTQLTQAGYEVEYSADQDNDAVRGRFKSVLGANS